MNAIAIVPGDRPAPPAWRGAAIALGVMDGVHLGHQAVLGDARAAAERLKAPLAAAVFEPHPRHHFQAEAAPFRLQSAGQRVRALEAAGAGAVFELRFGPALAALSKEEFAERELAGRLGVAHVAVGDDFRYGRGREGDAETLKAAGADLGFGVSVTPPLLKNGERVSSTAIRAHVAAGRMAEAAALLSRPWAIEGLVAGGDRRGRTLGFPTANMDLDGYVRPRFGIYAVRVNLFDGQAPRPGVANCGVRPMYGASAPLLETHLFDFAGDLYGRRIEVEMVGFLRPEETFADAAALTAQMDRDSQAAKALLSRPRA
jgi:riboflavin kinase/FMN adenylyltransferase